jgi:replicative DNA helicase
MLAKHRNWPTGDITLRFSREFTRFDSFTAREEPA